MSMERLGGEDEEPIEPALQSPFVPMLLLTLVMTGWFTFQAAQLVRERDTLRVMRAGQEKNVEESTKLRGSLDALLHETAALAANGNTSARLVVEGLTKRGITINPNTPSVRLSP
jgi:hypothetical protein